MNTFTIYDVSFNPNATEKKRDNFVHNEIIYTFLCSVGIVADIFLIVCLLRIKEMKTKRNLHVLNWAIADLLHLVAHIFSFRLIPDSCDLSKFDGYFCGIYESRAMFHTATIVFVFLLLVDCIFFKLTKRLFNIVAGSVWVVVFLITITSVTLCALGIYVPIAHTLLLLYFTVLFVTFLVYCCLCVKRKRNKIDVEDSLFRYEAAGLYVFCWFPYYVAFYLSLFLDLDTLYNVAQSVAITGYMNVVINLFLFSYLDRNYKLCFVKALKCRNNSTDDQIAYKENNAVEFVYTSLNPKPPMPPKPAQYIKEHQALFGTAV